MITKSYIKDMARQHAASALGKLERWASEYPAGVRLNISDKARCVAFVKQTQLAQALVAQATGEEIVDDDPDEDEPKSQSEVKTELLTVVLQAMASHRKGAWSFDAAVDEAKAIVSEITANWTLTERTR